MDDEHRAYRNYLYKMYLPLASQTQFVEAGVKEARNVSPTDRSEPLRSAYAVARSARVHSIDSLRVLKSTQRIEELITELKRTFTIVMVTHNMAQARRASDECIFMLMGEIIEHTRTLDMFMNPQHEKTAMYIEGRYG